MTNLLYIAGGGAAGALFRYGMSNGVHALLGRGFPYGTLVVNVVGPVLMGLCYVFLVERLDVDDRSSRILYDFFHLFNRDTEPA